MNNKGFTLVELIAVLVVMITILLIAIPSISSSIERNKGNLADKNEKIIEDAAEIYSDLHMDKILENRFSSGECGIYISDLIDNGLVDEKTTIIEKNNIIEELKEQCVWNRNKEYQIDECNNRRCGYE